MRSGFMLVAAVAEVAFLTLFETEWRFWQVAATALVFAGGRDS